MSDQVTRDAVISQLTETLKPLGFVRAFWEGGAVGYGRVDEWSDIDLYVLVEDGRAMDTFAVIEAAFRRLSGIKLKYGIPQTQWPGVHQAFYKLENASEYALVDLAIINETAPEKFLHEERHGKNTIYINRMKDLKIPAFDHEEFTASMRNRFHRLRHRLDMFGIFVQKELNRRDHIEALELYRGLVLSTLTELLRMKHYPMHYDFGFRYIHQELPADVAQRLEALYFVTDAEDLENKYRIATAWTREVMAELDGKL